MDVTVGYFLVALSAPAVVVVSASVLRRRNVPPLQDEDAEPEQGVLEQPKRKGYISASLITVLAIALTSGAVYASFRLSEPIRWQCAGRDAGIRTVVLERFERQSRNFNSTFNASDIPAVQTFFDAGMFYAYGFDHIEAIAMFAGAAEEDKELKCSLCTWGQAYALGPFVNRVMRGQRASSYPTFTCKDQQAAHTLAEKARNQAIDGSAAPLIVDLTDAMVQRYLPAESCNTTTLRRAELQYAQQLSHIANRHQDATVAALGAEAYMNVYAWKYTLSEKNHFLRGDTQAALDLLNYSLRLEPRHVLALHLKIHLLETQPLEATPDDGDATLAEGEAAADALAQLGVLPEMPGHLVHMPCHIYIRTGRWAEAVSGGHNACYDAHVPGLLVCAPSAINGNGHHMKASKASAVRDRQDSENCQVAYAPEHNLDMAQFAAMMGGDYESAQWSAQQLALAPKQQKPGYISEGINTAATAEVALYFGRCADAHVHRMRGSRGRSGTGTGPYMAVLDAFKDALCAVQSYYEDSRANGVSDVSPALASRLARLVATVEQSASKVAKDEPTKPGYGLGLYSAGYHTLAQMYALIAKAAEASVLQRWDESVRHLARAAKIEAGMGYIEPPRMVMILQPCLASVLAVSGDFVAGHKISRESLTQFPETVWGKKAAIAVDLSAAERSEHDIQHAAHAACPLIFGSANL